MRLIQFNSGLCVVLRDVQIHDNEHSLSQSNSSIATTSSSRKSHGSIGTHQYLSRRPFQFHRVNIDKTFKTRDLAFSMINQFIEHFFCLESTRQKSFRPC